MTLIPRLCANARTDLIYLSLALDINREQLINLVEEYYDYIHLHPNGNAKLHQVLKRKSLPKEIPMSRNFCL